MTQMVRSTPFEATYDIGVIEIRRIIRADKQDEQSTRTRTPSGNALLEDIIERHEVGQPILVGTVSIEKSEQPLSGKLRGVQHQCAETPRTTRRRPIIVAQAGRKGAVVVATNMAGRGVDIRPRHPSTPGAPGHARTRLGQRPVPVVRDGRS